MVITTTWEDVVLMASELSALSYERGEQILEDVAEQMNEDVWGTRVNLGARYLAAHLGTLDLRRGTGGPVTSETVGPVSRTYSASIADGAGRLGSTTYGLEYERLMMTLPAARFTICEEA